MNGLSYSVDEVVECPLCMEPLEVDDLNFYPCTCGYQICRFCWHRIRTDENELCPACRKEYPENPADFTPLTQEEMIAFKSQKRQRDQQRKQKITENRKHLANVRVVQKNLVFVVGLPPRLADADVLKKHEYFGKYGKIHKVVINPSTTYAGVQGPSASAYVTYVHNSDALRAIQSVNNIMIDGRLIKTSLGTTKYCSHFMKNQQCPKGDCMYLHELGDPEASFTKEEMHQGKHQEYEKRLHDALIASSGTNTSSGISQTGTNSNAPLSIGVVSATTTSCKTNENSKPLNGQACSLSAMSLSSSSSSSSSSLMTSGVAMTATVAAGAQQNEAWPSLSVSPVNPKEPVSGSNGKNKKDKARPEKPRNDKKYKTNSNRSNNNNNNSDSTTKENNLQQHLQNYGAKGLTSNTNVESDTNTGMKSRVERSKDKVKQEKSLSGRSNKDFQARQPEEPHGISLDEEIKMFDGFDKSSANSGRDVDNFTTIRSASNNFKSEYFDITISKSEDKRSLSSSSSSSSNSSERTSTLSESTSGKSSPDGFVVSSLCTDKSRDSNEKEKSFESALDGCEESSSQCDNLNLQQTLTNVVNKSEVVPLLGADSSDSHFSVFTEIESKCINSELLPTSNTSSELQSSNSNNIVKDTTATLSKLNLFDDSNSFFSSSSMASLQQSLLFKSKSGSEVPQNPMGNIPSHLPDLLNGVDGFQSNTTSSNDWEESFKTAVMRNSKQMENEFQHQHMQQQQLHHHQLQHQREEFLRAQVMHKRNTLDKIGLSPLSGPHNDFLNISNNFSNSTDLNRLSQAALLQQQQLLQLQQTSHATENILDNTGTNMSKFFDFHKNQQQQQQHIHQKFLLNGHFSGGGNGLSPEHLRMPSLLENNRINSQFVDEPSDPLAEQQKLQTHRSIGKYDLGQPVIQTQQKVKHQQLQPGTQKQTQSCIPRQFTQNTSVDDDLGFDPFIETQKALAELMENEMAQQHNTNVAMSNNTTTAAMKIVEHQQQQHQIAQNYQQPVLDNMQRARLPPPGFNHMNAFGFGMTRSQNTSNNLPFMNIGNNLASNNGQGTNQQMQIPNSWNPHVATFSQQHQTLGDPQMLQINQTQNGGYHNKGYNTNDWTKMDPAILSFRQFSFPQQSQMVHHPQHQDIFVQHMTQQLQQNNPGFNSQSQHRGGINLPNALLNPQQNSQAQMNYAQSNWLSNEQSLFMNSIGNGFTNNSFDKFSIPTPPGIHPNNLNKQKKQNILIK